MAGESFVLELIEGKKQAFLMQCLTMLRCGALLIQTDLKRQPFQRGG